MSTARGVPFYKGDRNRCKMKYTEHFPDQSVGTTFSPYRFAMNDVYDPYTGTGGHSASGFSVLSAQYNSRIVHGVKIRFTIQGIDMGDNDMAVRVVILGQSSAASQVAITDYQIACVQPGAVVRDLTVPASGGRSRLVWTGYFSVAKAEGLPNLHWGSYIATGTGSPANRPTVLLGLHSSAASFHFDLQVDAEFYTEWFSPLNAPLQLMDKCIEFAKAEGKFEEWRQRAAVVEPVVPHGDEKQMDEAFEDLAVATPRAGASDTGITPPVSLPVAPPHHPTSAALRASGLFPPPCAHSMARGLCCD